MDLLTWLLFAPAKLIALWPAAGFALGAVLIGWEAAHYWRRTRPWSAAFFREAPVFAGLLWILFNAYEWQVAATRLGGSPLRLDLIVLVPILYALTGMACLVVWRQFTRGDQRAE
jgi:hypothetical protein